MMNHDLIVFGEDWGGLPSSTQHLVKLLARDRKVLWINSIGLRRPRLNLHDIKRVGVKLTRSVSAIIADKINHCKNNSLRNDSNVNRDTETPSNLRIINPITIPVPCTKFERRCAVWLLNYQLQPVIKKWHLHKPILFVSLPTAVNMVGQLNESAVVYYCGDDFSGLAGVDHKNVALDEKLLVEKSDLIVAASAELAARFPQYKTLQLTHGVDYQLFSQPVARACDLPNNGKPIAGFYGSLSAWLEVELLTEVIKAMPHWDFVFIGKQEVDMSVLMAMPNTYFLGARPHSELPSYSQHWQASLLPFHDNAQIRACNPLKLVEYLAVGVPIVATRFPALAPYKHLVQQVSSRDDFILALEMTRYLSTIPNFSSTLKQSVANKTWRTKAQLLSRRLESL